jgi:hypothetical protein
MGHTRGVAVSLVNQSWLALAAGALDEAVRLAHESLRLCHMLGEREVLAEALDVLSAVAVTQQRMPHAATISGAAEALWEALRVARPPAEYAIAAFSQAKEALCARLTDADLAAAWAQGHAMSLDAIVVFALHGADAPAH